MSISTSMPTRRRSKAALASLALLLGGSVLAPSAHAADPTAPSAPTAVSARAGVNAAKVYFGAPTSDGGAPVSGFTATSVPEGKSCTAAASASSCYVTGLTNGQAYTFDVTASNAAGTSPAATTDPVTPRTDTTDPVLVSSEVTPDRVSSLGGDVIRVRLRITDDVSGRANPSGSLDANPAIVFSQRNGDGSFGFTRGVSRISGDEYDGVYQATVTVPAGTPAGDWDLTVYPIRDNAGNSTFFVDRPGVLVGAPGAPTDVSAALDPATPERDVVVSWTPPTDNGGNAITGYRVTDSHTGTTRTVSGTTWTGAFPDIDAEEQLTFTVVAVNSAGSSNPSAASTGILVPATAPSAPRDFTAARGDQQAVVGWIAPASTHGAPVTSYTVTAQPGGSSTTVSAPTTSATLPGLANGTAYTFTVTATNTAGTSPGATSAAVTPAGVPDAPTEVQARRGDESAAITWTAPEGNGADVTGYTVTAAPGGATVTTSGPTAGAIVPGLTNGTAYTFTVTALNDVGSSTASAPSAAVVPAGKPLAVSGVKAVRGDRRLAVSWTASTGNGSDVTAYVVTSNGVRTTVPATATGATLTGLRNGTTYKVTVSAVNELGEGAASAPVAGVPAGRPGVMAQPVATVKGRNVTLTWKPARANGAAISSYVVTGGKPSTRTVGGSVRKMLFKSLRPGTYKLRVKARNAVGLGSPSPAVIVRIR